jgi:DNA-binding MarR family transcriptional regulator
MIAADALQDRMGGGPPAKQSLRLWLRLLTCSTLVERDVSRRFRSEFGATLARFDVLSAVDRAGPDGASLGEISRMLMVTNGAVTGLVDRLRADGLVEVRAGADRRVQMVRLSAEGERRFKAMALAHEQWIEDLFSALDPAESDQLLRLLDRAKHALQDHARREQRP